MKNQNLKNHQSGTNQVISRHTIYTARAKPSQAEPGMPVHHTLLIPPFLTHQKSNKTTDSWRAFHQTESDLAVFRFVSVLLPLLLSRDLRELETGNSLSGPAAPALVVSQSVASWVGGSVPARVCSDGGSLLLVPLSSPVLTVVTLSIAESSGDGGLHSLLGLSTGTRPILRFAAHPSSTPPIFLFAPTPSCPAAVVSRRGVFPYISRPVDMAVAGSGGGGRIVPGEVGGVAELAGPKEVGDKEDDG